MGTTQAVGEQSLDVVLANIVVPLRQFVNDVYARQAGPAELAKEVDRWRAQAKHSLRVFCPASLYQRVMPHVDYVAAETKKTGVVPQDYGVGKVSVMPAA